MGGVLVMLALLAGFAAPAPTSPVHFALLARGPLIEAAEHPEWKQLLVQAAYRRADQIERLRSLPDMPAIVPAEPAMVEPTQTSEQIASLPATAPGGEPDDVTGSIDEAPGVTIPVEIGEASSIELPLREQDIQPPVEGPATLKRPHQSQRIGPARSRIRNAKARVKPPVQQETAQDFFSALFGKTGAADKTSAAQNR
jgi:hypothetical protein